MEQIFKSVLLLSGIGAILTDILLLLKPISKRVFGSRWQYYIWLVVLVVMMLPVSFKMPVKVNQTPIPQQTQTAEQNVTLKENTNIGTPNLATGGAVINQPTIPVSKTVTLSIFDILMYAWILGALIFFCGGIISYLRFLRIINKNSKPISCPELEALKIEKKIKRKVHVKITDCTTAPLMVGIFKATLLLPNVGTSKQELHYILLHELTHLKRNDLLYKWFAMLVNSVHWFNPLIYFACKQINEECEISCDLAVTKNLSNEDKKAYMSTIVSLASGNRNNGKMLTTAMASSKKQIKRRFTMINKAKKTSKFMLVISIITAMVILSTSVFASGVLANAINGEKNFIIDGVGYDIKPIFIENTRYLHTDSYYLPLRETFEALGCAIKYNVDKNLLSPHWQITDHMQTFPQYDWRENLVVDDITSQIYGATMSANDMPIIEVVSPQGRKFYYQIGCELMWDNEMEGLFGGTNPPIIINGKAYVSIRTVAQFLIPTGESSDESISWNDKDVYFLGRLLWNEETQTVIIDRNAKSVLSEFVKTSKLLNTEKTRVMQRIENGKYAICMVENYANQDTESCIAIEKSTGYITMLESFDKNIAFKLRLSFSDSHNFLLKIMTGTNGNETIFSDYRKWDLSQCEFVPLSQ